MLASWWWIDRWRKSTAYTDMSAEEQGVYRNLLDELWLRDGVIPDDERILAKIGGDHEAWPRVRVKVLARFTKTAAGLTNRTHDEVAGQSKRRRDNQKAYRDRLRESHGADNAHDNGADNKPDNKPDSPSPVSVSVLRSPSPPPNPPQAGGVVAHPKRDRRAKPPTQLVRATWLTPYGDAWTQSYGGTPPWGELAKALQLHEAALGADEVLERWRLYCAHTPGRYASPTRFAQTIGVWTPQAIASARPEDIRSMTVGQFNARTLDRVMAKLGPTARALPGDKA